jgi:phosphopantetheine--protein transferase-like protein
VIGIDLVDIEEFRRQLLLGGERFLRRAFHEHELVDQDAARLAGLWAAKEAVVKASLTPPGRFADVMIASDRLGRCYGAIGEQRFDLSMSCDGHHVVAVAMAVDR